MAKNNVVTREDFEILKALYKEAVDKEEKSLIFKEKEVLVGYAKHMIEYLKTIYKNNDNYEKRD